MDEIVARINELSRKQKKEGLTPEETAEQKQLRDQYINGFKRSLRNQLENITLVDGEDQIKH
ncbi:hypothetical protein SY83_17995 [Paenibacillus swuensis]|uniref:UPF0291 protein SY83_17995 n=1 Tax=Paenibacillus swuensis TaxID=1178515 RepID=A0A172TLG4_9BACL|nr:DUF896 domain-containing protein [Paenibacillus swuensis]ANE47870.1 hypothetical protein SY83_17995 [Paenibacillus swuensis]